MPLLRVDRPVDVLIAEADEWTRHGLRRLLERDGYHCAEASTSQEAVEVAHLNPPQYVLLDLLSTSDHLEVARRLRADLRTHAAHIHCLAWPTDRAAQVEIAKSGCDAIISKPIHVNELLALVHSELGSPLEWARGLSMREAENLLDWLERQGTAGQIRMEANQTFAVRCPGFRATRDATGDLTIVRE